MQPRINNLNFLAQSQKACTSIKCENPGLRLDTSQSLVSNCFNLLTKFQPKNQNIQLGRELLESESINQYPIVVVKFNNIIIMN